MVCRASRIVQTVRDAILLVLSLVLISTDIGPGKEASNFLLAGICAVIFVLTVVNIVLNVFKIKKKGYFFGNSVFQLIIGFVMLGLFFPLGIILVGFNLAVLVTLWEKKTLEEQMKHPSRPITKKYRAFVGAGVVAMFVAIFLSWLSAISFPLIGIYLRTADLTSAANIVSNTITTIIGILAIVLTPVTLISGILGLFKRRFALISGILSIIIGTGWIVTLTTMAGPGAYVFVFGGALVIAALLIVK